MERELKSEQDMPNSCRENGVDSAFRLFLLFLALFSFAFAAWSVISGLALTGDDHELTWKAKALIIVSTPMPGIVGYALVALFNIRRPLAVRYVAYPAGIMGAALAIYATYLGMEPLLTEADRIFLEGILWVIALMPLLSGLLAGELSAWRSGFLFSEKTNRWLRSYRTRKRFSFVQPVQSLDGVGLEDILDATPAGKAKNHFSLVLFIDSIPDSKHFLKITVFPKPKRRFFSLKIAAPPPQSVTLPVNWRQIEEVSKRFGPFGKTLFIDPPSVLRPELHPPRFD